MKLDQRCAHVMLLSKSAKQLVHTGDVYSCLARLSSPMCQHSRPLATSSVLSSVCPPQLAVFSTQSPSLSQRAPSQPLHLPCLPWCCWHPLESRLAFRRLLVAGGWLLAGWSQSERLRQPRVVTTCLLLAAAVSALAGPLAVRPRQRTACYPGSLAGNHLGPHSLLCICKDAAHHQLHIKHSL